MADPQLTAEQIAKATAEYQKQKDILESLNDEFDAIEKNLVKSAAAVAYFASQNRESKRQVSELKGIYNDLSKSARILSNSAEDYSKGLLKTKDITKTINNLTSTEDRLVRQITQAKKDGNAGLASRLITQLKILDAEKKAAERLQAQNKEIDKAVGLTGKLANSLSKIPILGDSLDFEDVNAKMRLAAKNGENVFKAGFKEVGKQVKESLEDPLIRFAIGLKLVKSGFDDIKKAFNIFLEYDKIFVDTARNLGLSEEKISGIVTQAKAADTAIRGINGQTFDTIYTATQLAKSFAEVNNQLGLSVDLGAETLNEFTAMTNQMGLSADEATKLYKIGVLNNMSLEDTNKAIVSGIISTQKQTGVQVNARQVLQEIGKLSAGITTKFQQNPEALAKAVAQAKALGTNLEQVDKVSESILNFESSIENELKAELLTGKQINLEKARYAALTGDQATLTQELADQVGSLGEFQEMNVLAQRSLAEAFGLSRDEVADMLTKQETFKKLGDVSNKSAQEQLEIAKKRGLSETDSLMVNLKQQATAEKTAAAFDNFKSAIADVLIGLKPLLDMFVELSKQTWLVYGGLSLMAGLSFAKTIGGLVLMASQLGLITSFKAAGAAADAASTAAIGAQVAETGALSAANAALTSEKIAQAVATAIANPFVAVAGMVAAAAAAAFIANAALKKPKMAKGGIVVPTPGGTDVTVGEAGSAEAIIPLNSPKAGEMLGINRPTQPSFNASAITDAIATLSSTVNSLVNRPNPTPQFALNVDGRTLGTIVGRQMETGTSQIINTGYQLA
jgi:hypothetical protein